MLFEQLITYQVLWRFARFEEILIDRIDAFQPDRSGQNRSGLCLGFSRIGLYRFGLTLPHPGLAWSRFRESQQSRNPQNQSTHKIHKT
jgi:hypothetical protein